MWTTLQLCLAFAALGGCSSSGHGSKHAEVKFDSNPAAPAEYQLPAHPVKKPSPPQQSAPARSGPRRGFLLHDVQQSASGEGGGQQDGAHLSPRLQKAAELKTWAPVKIEGSAVEVCLKTSWTQDQINVRVAMVGPQQVLDKFVTSVKGYQLRFTDPDGTELMNFDIQPQDFQWAPPTVNNGIPTMQLEGSIPCPLEPYENSSNWTLNWN